MTQPALVCPFEEELLAHLGGGRLVVTVTTAAEIPRVAEWVKSHHIDLKCVLWETTLPLAEAPFQADWGRLPLALKVSSLGPFPEVANRLPVMRRLNLRVYLSLDHPGNYSALRILSSLGIATALCFDRSEPDWEALADLATYALLGRANHAPMEPFAYLARHYRPEQHTDFSAVYFADPVKYLHVNAAGEVALSAEELGEGNLLVPHFRELGDLQKQPAYLERLESWKQHFLLERGCAYCQGWRICLGKFGPPAVSPAPCEEFFAELLDLVEQAQRGAHNGGGLWQP